MNVIHTCNDTTDELESWTHNDLSGNKRTKWCPFTRWWFLMTIIMKILSFSFPCLLSMENGIDDHREEIVSVTSSSFSRMMLLIGMKSILPPLGKNILRVSILPSSFLPFSSILHFTGKKCWGKKWPNVMQWKENHSIQNLSKWYPTGPRKIIAEFLPLSLLHSQIVIHIFSIVSDPCNNSILSLGGEEA